MFSPSNQHYKGIKTLFFCQISDIKKILSLKIITSVAEGILQYDLPMCNKLVCVLLDQLNLGGMDLIQPTLDCLGKILVLYYPTRVMNSYSNKLIKNYSNNRMNNIIFRFWRCF